MLGVSALSTSKIGVAGREAERAEVWLGIDHRVSSRGLTILPYAIFFMSHLLDSQHSHASLFHSL